MKLSLGYLKTLIFNKCGPIIITIEIEYPVFENPKLN